MNNFDFIEQVRTRPCLWAARAHDGDVADKEAAWEEVAQTMGCPRDVLKSRWKNLRDTYRKLIRRTKRKAAPDAVKWPYCQAMEFMYDILANSKVKIVDITTKVEYACDDAATPKIEYAYEGDSVDATKINCGFIADDDDDEDSTSTVDEAKERRGVKRAAADAQDGGEDDGDDCQFLLSLLPYIKQVPRCRKLPLRVKIEQLIYDEVYNNNS